MKIPIPVYIGISIVIAFFLGSYYQGTNQYDIQTADIEPALIRINALEAKVAELERKVLTESEIVDLIEMTARVADYDSGWVDCSKTLLHNTFEHNLGTIEYTVYFWGAYWNRETNDGWIYHQRGIGGATNPYPTFGGGVNPDDEEHIGVVLSGATENKVFINRYLNDEHWEKIRVLIYKIP
jgi:hypothetical protein